MGFLPPFSLSINKSSPPFRYKLIHHTIKCSIRNSANIIGFFPYYPSDVNCFFVFFYIINGSLRLSRRLSGNMKLSLKRTNLNNFNLLSKKITVEANNNYGPNPKLKKNMNSLQPEDFSRISSHLFPAPVFPCRALCIFF